jgi:glutamate N-acetyltransferase/amino-acid N-acetyltransferase
MSSSDASLSFQLPDGFHFAGVGCGIKDSGKLDLALIVSERPCVAAGVYTQNLIRASSIDWNRNITPTDQFRGLVVNSGNANACTGAQGETDNRLIASELARLIDAQPDQVAVLSTGVIGHLLPMDKIRPGIEAAKSTLGKQSNHFELASTAILTTDKSTKTAHSEIEINGQTIRIAAMAKGAGMIGPNMATMLAVVTTDANLSSTSAQEIIQRVADQSFNQISVEGHTSTNDALMLLANGSARESNPNQPNSQLALSGNDLSLFEAELNRVCIDLAKMIPADGEGASHLMCLSISGASTNAEADRIARSIAQSALVKTAITGNDPNWGRIVSAAGYSGVDFDPAQVSLKLNGIELFRAGTPLEFSAAEASQTMSDNFETQIELSVGTGPGSANHWSSDMTVEYVRFNSEYHT